MMIEYYWYWKQMMELYWKITMEYWKELMEERKRLEYLKKTTESIKKLEMLECPRIIIPKEPQSFRFLPIGNPEPSFGLAGRLGESHLGRARPGYLKRKCSWEEALATMKEKRTKKRCRTLNGPNEVQVELIHQMSGIDELLKKKTVVEVLKIFEDRVDGMIEKDKMTDFVKLRVPELKYLDLRIEIKEVGKHSLIRIHKDNVNLSYGQGARAFPKFPCPTVSNAMLDIQDILFNDKKTVKFSSFKGLEEALLEAVGDEIPKYLQDIASKIQKAIAITETDYGRHHNILILVYAAVHEMENCVGVAQLNWDRLSIWAATYNMAKAAGLQVEFVEQHLKKILNAYLGFYLKKWGDPEETVQADHELNIVKKCLSAEESFQGKPLSHGLFS